MTATARRKGGASGRRHVTPDDVAEMVRLWDRGWQQKQIAERLCRGEATVSRHLTEHRRLRFLEKTRESQPSRSRPVRFTRDERAFVEHYLMEGYSLAAVAEALGRHSSTVRGLCEREGIAYTSDRGRTVPGPRIFNGARPDVTSEQVRAMVQAARETGTLAGTARAVGASEQYVERVLQHHAPADWHAYIRRSGLDPASMFDAVRDDWRRRERDLIDGNWAMSSVADWDAFARVHGPDRLRAWIDDLDAERRAITRVRAALRRALERAGQ